MFGLAPSDVIPLQGTKLGPQPGIPVLGNCAGPIAHRIRRWLCWQRRVDSGLGYAPGIASKHGQVGDTVASVVWRNTVFPPWRIRFVSVRRMGPTGSVGSAEKHKK